MLKLGTTTFENLKFGILVFKETHVKYFFTVQTRLPSRIEKKIIIGLNMVPYFEIKLFFATLPNSILIMISFHVFTVLTDNQFWFESIKLNFLVKVNKRKLDHSLLQSLPCFMHEAKVKQKTPMKHAS